MPKITGPTVVEHRAAQHRALLDASERLINDSGGNVPTLTEVAEAMGLARSSVYLYVKSRKDLVVQLLLDVIPNWTGGITDAMEAAGADPLAQLKVYVDETFRLFIEGDHGPLMVAAQQIPEAFMDPRVQEAHNALEPVLTALLLAGPGLEWHGWAGLGAGVYVGLFEMGIAFVLWQLAVHRVSRTAKVSNLIFLSPPVSLLLLFLVVGEPILPSTLVGLVLILAGLGLQQWQKAPAHAAQESS